MEVAMMQEMNVALGQWAGQSNELLQRVHNECKAIDYHDSALPQSVFAADKPLSIVFAGQYSAGKSTILKALTGVEDIAIGEGITTQVAHTYDWNGIQVIDTPGIHTTLRPDHDEISYQAMESADMLVYVVTKELFDDFIGQKFRKLLIDADKAGEMILVVNKMGDVGNTPENRRIKAQDLEKVDPSVCAAGSARRVH
jgi:ferrous iron transport protein B